MICIYKENAQNCLIRTIDVLEIKIIVIQIAFKKKVFNAIEYQRKECCKIHFTKSDEFSILVKVNDTDQRMIW